MDYFIPNKQHLLEVLLYLFNIEKSATKSNELLVKAYGNNDRTIKSTCSHSFKDGKPTVSYC